MITASLLCDYYKMIHKTYYPEGLEKVWAYFTPRQSRIKEIDYVIPFGVQGMCNYLTKEFERTFFSKSWFEVVEEMKYYIRNTFDENYDFNHFRELHELGYLPIEIKLLVKEGEKCPIGCPILQITNTHPNFVWIVNFIETLMSTLLWHPITSATIAYRYREIAEKYARDENLNSTKVPYLIGDFSMRGQTSPESAARSSAGFLTSFYKTSCIPAIDYLEFNYLTNCEKEIVGLGGLSTEHSVMSLLGQDEEKAIQYIIDNTNQGSTIAIVSDTWDYWNMLTTIYPKFKDTLKEKNVKINVRPDSGDPVKIICGYVIYDYDDLNKEPLYTSDVVEFFPMERISIILLNLFKQKFPVENINDVCIKIGTRYFIPKLSIFFNSGVNSIAKIIEISEEEAIGSVETLYNEFGGTVNEHGFKVLDPCIGLIYGDSITMERANEIYSKLHKKKFSIENVVLCAGSYSLQYVTRDTFGFAQKITAAMINKELIPVYKDPKTSDSTKKKSHKGIVNVVKNLKNEYTFKDEQAIDLNRNIIYLNGKVLSITTLQEIRNSINKELKK